MNRLRLQLVISAVLLGAGSFAASDAEARPGGGQGFSGGGSRGGGGGSFGGGSSYRHSSGGSTPITAGGLFLFVGLNLLVLGLINVFQTKPEYDSREDFEAGDAPIFPQRIEWAALVARDPKFSPIVFQDFVYQLYASAHRASGEAQALAALAPYLSAEVRQAIAFRHLGERITGVIIGSMQVTGLRLDAQTSQIDLRFESNVHGEHASTYYVEEWQLERASGVQSKPPEQARALACPNCGAPFQSTTTRCEHCGEIVDGGRFDWYVTRVHVRETKFDPPPLGGYAPEVGSELATLVSPSFDEHWASLLADDPRLHEAHVRDRITAIYERLNTAWVARDLASVRADLSDGMYDYLNYWIDAYRRQGLINCMERAEVEAITLVKLQRDAWFDALTVRVFARGLDYTIRELDGQLVGGSPTQTRGYSEYWTLIRGANVRGEARSDLGCPNCGAPLTINMAGSCEHCSAHVTRGEFDWVLSRIEQDESYLG